MLISVVLVNKIIMVNKWLTRTSRGARVGIFPDLCTMETALVVAMNAYHPFLRLVVKIDESDPEP